MPGSKHSSFSTDIFKLVTGTTLAQIISVLASPLVTRLYSPEAYGLLALFTSITSILGVIACMRYELAIMLPKTDEGAANLLGLSLLCAAGISGLTVPALYLGGGALLTVINTPGLAPYLYLIPLFVFINGIFLALNYWNSRTKHFGRLSVARVTKSLSNTGTQLGAGFAGYSTGGSLIGAALVGSAISTGVLGGQIWHEDHALLYRSISWKGILDGLKRYKKFPLIDSGSALLNTISWQLPAFLLAAFFSPVVVGFYSLGFMVLQLPMSLIGSAIAQVFFQRAAEAYHHGSLASLAEDIFKVLLKVGVFPMLLLAVAGETIFIVIFGAAWSEAGIYAQLLSIWAIFWFISSPLSLILSVREKLTVGFNLNVLIFVTRLLSLVIGGVLGNAVLAIALFSISGIFVYGFTCLVYLKFAGVPVSRTLHLITKSFAFAVPFIIPLIGLEIFTLPEIVTVLVTLLVSVAYGIVILLRDPLLSNLIAGLKIKL